MKKSQNRIPTNSTGKKKTDAHAPATGHTGPEAADESLVDDTDSPREERERESILRAKQEGDVP